MNRPAGLSSRSSGKDGDSRGDTQGDSAYPDSEPEILAVNQKKHLKVIIHSVLSSRFNEEHKGSTYRSRIYYLWHVRLL